jgi:hypothetical protein
MKTMELNQTRIEDAIVQEVSDRIIDNEELTSRVMRAVDGRIDTLFKSVADAQIKTAVETAIQQGFDHEYRRVNSFGQPEGKPTTIRLELEKAIGGYWNTMVGRDGKPMTDSYNAKMTRAEWTMTQLVAADFQGEMKQHVVNLGGALKDKLRAELHDTVNKLLSEVFRVRSVGDEAAKRSDRSSIDPKQTGAV